MFETTLTLAGTGKQPMMSSREIAELTGKEHKIVLRRMKFPCLKVSTKHIISSQVFN